VSLAINRGALGTKKRTSALLAESGTVTDLRGHLLLPNDRGERALGNMTGSSGRANRPPSLAPTSKPGTARHRYSTLTIGAKRL
jgi:hypothetical protein